MRQGKYFRIPENPTDIEELWGEGKLLTAASLPAWLGPEHASSYRYVGTYIAALAAAERDSWLVEQEALEAAGFVFDPDRHRLRCVHLYIPAPSEDVWSIGIYSGRSAFELCLPERCA